MNQIDFSRIIKKSEEENRKLQQNFQKKTVKEIKSDNEKIAGNSETEGTTVPVSGPTTEPEIKDIQFSEVQLNEASAPIDPSLKPDLKKTVGLTEDLNVEDENRAEEFSSTSA